MTQPQHASPTAPADLLRFVCTHCGAVLEVPQAMAGVRGPCPVCAHEATAPVPVISPLPAVSGVAQLLTKPPPRRERPPPMAPVPDAPVPAIPLRPVPLPDTFPPAPRVVHPDNPPQPQPQRAPASRRAPFPARERGIFGEEDGDGPDEEDLPRRTPTFRRHPLRRLIDTAIVALFTAVILTSVAALRFTIPRVSERGPRLPDNLNEQVERETNNMKLRGLEAGELAQAAVSRYLGAASGQAAASHLLPPPEGMPPPPFPPFAAPLPSTWQVQSSRRIAGTDKFLVVVQPKDQPGPLFVVEQTDSGPRLHAGPISQQSAGLYQKFVASAGEGEGTLYTEVRPAHPDGERAWRAQRPDLSGYVFVDVRSAFPGDDLKDFIACFKPGSEAAKSFAARSHDSDWRPAIVQLGWRRHQEAGPFAEVMKFIPGPWSSGRLLPALATASTGTP